MFVEHEWKRIRKYYFGKKSGFFAKVVGEDNHDFGYGKISKISILLNTVTVD